MRRLEVKIGVEVVEGEVERRRRQRRLRWRRRKQSARETMTVTARTVMIMRMLGLRFCNGEDERRGEGGGRVVENGVNVSDPMTFRESGGGEAIVEESEMAPIDVNCGF